MYAQFGMLQNSREAADALHARDRYVAACAAMPGLGQRVRTDAVADGGGPAIAYRIVATADIEEGAVISAFPADGVMVRDPLMSCAELVETGGVLATNGDAVYGPLAESRPYDVEAMVDYAVPVSGFDPVYAVVPDMQLEHPPATCAHWTEDVHSENIYEGLEKRGEPAIRTLAQITVAYLCKVTLLSNVRMEFAAGRPAVIVALRDIRAGEVVRTGRPPLFHLGGDRETAGRICEEIVRTNPLPGTPPERVREMMGL